MESRRIMESRSEHQERVEAFMKLAQQELPTFPVVPNLEVRILRATLILEEALETIKALGFTVTLGFDDVTIKSIVLRPQYTPNLVEIVDGCCDLKVVTTGTLSACGVADEDVQKEVDENNLAKFGPGGYRREDGKWVKPPNHQPPNINKILESQQPICPECRNEVDLNMCWCGNLREDHGVGREEHGFVPIGCTCGFPKENKR